MSPRANFPLHQPTTDIPWAKQLTFRTDQTRYRRDHAKYLALIAASTLLHQYQRPRLTRSVAGREQACVVATLEDLELANRLASAVIGEQVDSLLPHTRRLLSAVSHYVARRATDEGVTRGAVRFTQRQLREALPWSDRSLRTHLTRLLELEYVLVYRTRRGNQRANQLLGEAAESDHSPDTRLQLADVEQLRQHLPRRGD